MIPNTAAAVSAEIMSISSTFEADCERCWSLNIIPVAALQIKNAAHQNFHDLSAEPVFGADIRNSETQSSATPSHYKSVAPSRSTNTPKAVEISSDEQPMNEVSETGPVDSACILQSRKAAETSP